MEKTSEQMIDEVLADPAASYWLKNCLRSALERDALDAKQDARLLAHILSKRAREILEWI